MGNQNFFKWAFLIVVIVVPIELLLLTLFVTPAGIKELSKAIAYQEATPINKFDAQREIIEEAAENIISAQEKVRYIRALEGEPSVKTWQDVISDSIAKAGVLNFIAPRGKEYIINKGGLNNLGTDITARIQKAKPLLLERGYYEAVAIGVLAARLSELAEKAKYTGYPESLPLFIGCVAGYVGSIRAEKGVCAEEETTDFFPENIYEQPIIKAALKKIIRDATEDP